MKRAIVTGAAGFIGGHLVEFLKAQGYWVRGVDLVAPHWRPSAADEFICGDLRLQDTARHAITEVDEVYMLAADMGGMGYIEGAPASIAAWNARVNIATLEACRMHGVQRTVFASSACVYPDTVEIFADATQALREEDAAPWLPSAEGYGWEKAFTEQLCAFYHREHGLDTGIVRFHNVYGPYGSWCDGREKAPAALCRKTAEAVLHGKDSVSVWGDGHQVRSFLYVDDAVRGIWNVAQSGYHRPVNVGSDEAIAINDLARLIFDIAGFHGEIEHMPGPVGVIGRCSDNRLYEHLTGELHETSLRAGLERTYAWISQMVSSLNSTAKATAPASPS